MYRRGIILSDIIDTYKSFMRKKVESGGRRIGLHVSDLVSDCLRRGYYRMNDSNTPKHDDDSICNFYYGTVIHESFDGMFDIMEKHMCVNPFEELVDEEIVDIEEEIKNNPYKWVSGSADVITDEFILDFKTSKKMPNKPSDSYIRQVNFYSYMYYLHTGIEIKKGAILYLIKETGLTEHRIFEFDLDDIETNRLKMMRAMDIISQEEPPKQNPNPLCTVCPYKTQCDPHGYYDYKQKKMIY